ncbi:MAG: nucleotidyltransferase family protein [Acidibacillus sp.]|nr:nucleotidyltransferase family protein [Acidibacillus sp.]
MTTVISSSHAHSIAGIILAAGQSTRMGRPKALLEVDGRPMIRFAVEAALQADVSPIWVIAGQWHQAMASALSDLPVTVIYNKDFREGMSTSLRLGILQAKDAFVQGAMILLADQPFISSSLLSTLLYTYKKQKQQGILIVRPTHNHVPNHPVIFDASLFPEFSSLRGDEGARSIIAAHASHTLFVPCQEPMWHLDIDTNDEWERLKPDLQKLCDR